MTENKGAYQFNKDGILRIIRSVLVVVIPFVVIPGVSYLVWLVSPAIQKNVLVIDKTVSDEERQEHRSIFWALKHLRYQKSNGEDYHYKKDYFGYFPDYEEDNKAKGLERLTPHQLDSVKRSADVVYLVDNYGVYRSDFNKSENGISPKIYGGLTKTDVELLRYSLEKGKLVFAEFNSMGAPTSRQMRSEFENLLSIKWTGWISRYFDEMDTVINKEIPQWLIDNYIEQHEEATWSFEGAAQIFVSEFGQIEIMEEGVDINFKVPKVVSPLKSQTTYGLPKEANYPYWFEILRIDRTYEVLSYFDLGPTTSGVNKLKAMGLPRYFPAAITRPMGESRVYYFTGDFADNPVNIETASFFGIPTLSKIVNEKDDYSNRTSFFWNYYLPLMKHALNEHK
ncbi:hypothetical protein DN752_24035 [Echinicola strongylocentroti]|uniref:Uncharacterized protein n=1 Tax=Echinicola strongylocentroti TaxID=1795355 RepID=A0A2Z4IQ34_9BACT|nr:hypothetical protein [Echinicola strongylocentroti]AWW32947.1 hypothetical protein DN752_24035 [Echinicola strongylocentroti]